MDLNEFVVRAQRGEADAFEELVRRTTRLVFARCVLETGDPHRAEDLVQETFLTAYRSIRQLKTPDTFRSWLLRIAQNACIDAHRRDARLRRAPPPRAGTEALDGVAAPAADDAMVQGESRERVLAILRSLPEDYRLPLTLRYLGGADFESIQQQMGITPGSLRGLLNRGLQLLRVELKRALGPEFAGGLK